LWLDVKVLREYRVLCAGMHETSKKGTNAAHRNGIWSSAVVTGVGSAYLSKSGPSEELLAAICAGA
jgi:hypothetical protein